MSPTTNGLAAEGDRGGIFGPTFFVDPYPTYRWMRDEHPVYFDEASALWFISRHQDVATASDTPSLFSSARGNAIIDSPLRIGRTLGSMDPPRHDELRAIMVQGFTPKRVSAALPTFRRDVEGLLSAVADQRRCDLVADLTRPALLSALARMLGLDEAAANEAASLQAGLFHSADGPLGSALGPEDMAAVFALLSRQMERRRREPDDDLFSVLLQAQRAGSPLSDDEIVANMATVLLAGAASVGHFVPNLVHALWANPEQRAAVLADPTKIDQAVEEAVRWDTATQSFARNMTADFKVGQTTIPAGARVVLLYGSANRDERAMAEPDAFNLARGRVRHFGFGGGPHHCLGAPVARQLSKAFLQAFLPHLGEYELDVTRAKRVEHIMVRGFRSVPLSW